MEWFWLIRKVKWYQRPAIKEVMSGDEEGGVLKRMESE